MIFLFTTVSLSHEASWPSPSVLLSLAPTSGHEWKHITGKISQLNSRQQEQLMCIYIKLFLYFVSSSAKSDKIVFGYVCIDMYTFVLGHLFGHFLRFTVATQESLSVVGRWSADISVSVSSGIFKPFFSRCILFISPACIVRPLCVCW